MHLIILGNFGPQSMPDHPNRAWHDEKRAMLDDLVTDDLIRGRIHDVWWTAGQYDLVIHAEVRSAVGAHALSLTLSRKLKANNVALIAIPDAEVGPVFDVLEIRNGP